MNQNFEKRTSRDSSLGLSEENGNTLTGYIALFNTSSVDMGFTEILAPGCFTSSLENPDEDVVCLVNHDDDAPIGRVSAGTLKLAQDEQGLAFSVDLPDNHCRQRDGGKHSQSRDLYPIMANDNGFIPISNMFRNDHTKRKKSILLHSR
ncbi:HK97 family phage prohead protease [Terriglobus roseus]|uniref:Phage prohead protease, HK97 family n=1 Tax=Terriglobus roseus TaxID=392734 RepID=A0A1G7G5R3_9BACT|nr:HK97 family phage prohead protease [Terriglobus roseus]SDE83458.1 phage prohead protease, HK97 family [Terriglobus roseus]